MQLPRLSVRDSIAGRRASGSATRSRACGSFFWSLSGVGWFDADQAHHASIFVFEKMTVVQKSADGVGVAKIHAQADAGKLQIRGAVEGHVDGVAQERLINADSVPCH